MDGTTVEVDMVWLNDFALQIYPTCIAQMLILLEAIRTLPAEMRMYRRAWKRKRFNAAEMLFLSIKYLAIVAWCCDAVVQNTAWPTSGEDCRAIHSISYFFQFFAVTGVATAIAWRTYVVFYCSRPAYWILMAGLAGHMALSLWTAYRQPKASYQLQGFCNVAPFKQGSIWSFSVVWYLIYNVLFDGLVTGFASWRLLSRSRQLTGLSHVSKVLFVNNIHYVIIVCGANFAELIYLLATNGRTRSLIGVSMAIQIITGLNMLIREQDFVHAKTPGRLMRGNFDSPSSGMPRSTMPLRYQQTTLSSVPCQRGTMGTCTDKSHDCLDSFTSAVREQRHAPFAGITYDLEQSGSQASFCEADKEGSPPSWDVTSGASVPSKQRDGEVDEKGSGVETMNVSYPKLDHAPQVSPFQSQSRPMPRQAGGGNRASMSSNRSLSSIRTLRAKLMEQLDQPFDVKAQKGGENQRRSSQHTPMFEISAPSGDHYTGQPSLAYSLGGPPTTAAECGAMASNFMLQNNSTNAQPARPTSQGTFGDTSPTSTQTSLVASTFGGPYRGSLGHAPRFASTSESPFSLAIMEQQRLQHASKPAQGAGAESDPIKQEAPPVRSTETEKAKRYSALASSASPLLVQQHAKEMKKDMSMSAEPQSMSFNSMAGSPPRVRRSEHVAPQSTMLSAPQLSISGSSSDSGPPRHSILEEDTSSDSTTVMAVTPGRLQATPRASAGTDYVD